MAYYPPNHTLNPNPNYLRPNPPHLLPRLAASAHHNQRTDPLDRASGHLGYQPKVRVADRYKVVGFISSGTYGRVYKALTRRPAGGASGGPNSSSSSGSSSGAAIGGGGSGGSPVDEFVAIKKFKPDKEGEQVSYTGISQSAIREMSLCTELSHANIIRLVEIILEDKCIFMVFEYAEHDLLQIIHHHTQQPRQPIPASVIRSIMFQLLNGCHYLHSNWVLHRDLKPANIMVTSEGEVKIGDLGLARRFDMPLHSLFSGDKVVVTIWYRAPELILGSHHYTPAIDLWAVGCIFAELMSLRPIFKGEEAKIDNKKTVPFQRNQMQRIVDIMGVPNKENWPLLTAMPEAGLIGTLQPPATSNHHHRRNHRGETTLSIQAQNNPNSSNSSPNNPNNNNNAGGVDGSQLEKWYFNTISQGACSSAAQFAAAPANVTSSPLAPLGAEGFNLLARMLEYDPVKRLTAAQALQHSFFGAGDKVSGNCFEGLKVEYPHRRVSQDDTDIRTSSVPGTKRGGLPDDTISRPVKRPKER